MTLSALVPIDLTESMLISSTLAEPASSETAWSSATSYTAGDVCILTSDHRRYKALQASTNKDPSSTANINVYWADDGPTNKWAMFDGGTSYASSGTSPLTVVLEPGFVNAVYLGGLVASDLTVTVRDAPAGNIIYSTTTSLEGSAPDNWYDYYFMPFSPSTDYLVSGIEPYANMQITIDLTGSGTLSCGMCAVGDLRPIGQTLSGAKARPKSYSTIKTTNGISTIVRRRAGNDLTMTALASLSEANSIHATLMSLIDVPCLWVGTSLPQYQGLRSWGLGVGSISYDHPQHAVVSIEVTGLLK